MKKKITIIICIIAVLLFSFAIGYGLGKNSADRTRRSTETDAAATEQMGTVGESPSLGESETVTQKESGPSGEEHVTKESEQQTTAQSAEATKKELPTTNKEAETTQKQSPTTKKEPSTTKKQEQTTAKPKPSVTVPSGTAVKTHGALSVAGTQLVDKNKKPVQLRGVSTFFLQYANRDAFLTMRDEWGINMVRIPLYTAGYNGYCTSDAATRAKLKEQVYGGIDAAIELGLYVIVDWHVLHEGDPNVYLNEAKTFFAEVSQKYGGYDNILYEICNEPNGGVSWSGVKSYAEKVIPVIRKNDKDAVILVGSPTWSQDVDKAAADPIKGYSNLMYTLHFYAETHREWLRERMVSAINSGLPVFVSEFGISDASGNGNINKSEGDAWIATMNKYGVSYGIWSLCNKAESSALLLPSVTKLSGWSYNDLTESGKWWIQTLKANPESLGSSTPVNPKPQETTKKPTEQTTKKPTEQTTKKPVTGGGSLKSSVNVTNAWESNGKKYTQYSLELTNDSGSAVNGWTCEIVFSGNVAVSQSWCGMYSVSGNTLTIRPESYNGVVASGATVKDIGFILESASDVTVKSVTCK